MLDLWNFLPHFLFFPCFEPFGNRQLPFLSYLVVSDAFPCFLSLYLGLFYVIPIPVFFFLFIPCKTHGFFLIDQSVHEILPPLKGCLKAVLHYSYPEFVIQDMLFLPFHLILVQPYLALEYLVSLVFVMFV